VKTDDKTNRDQPDRRKIDISQEHEVQYWTKRLGVSREELQRVLEKVGDSATAVRRELGVLLNHQRDDDKIVNIGPKLRARAEAQVDNRTRTERSAEHLRAVWRMVREMRELGATTLEIARTLRVVAEELEGANRRP
jgi:hypothetical protein